MKTIKRSHLKDLLLGVIIDGLVKSQAANFRKIWLPKLSRSK
jgi:hypothetical protein